MTRVLIVVREAWRWWIREFRAALPGLPSAHFFPPRRRLLLRASPSATEISVVKGGSVEWRENLSHPIPSSEAAQFQERFKAEYGRLGNSAIAVLDDGDILQAALRLPGAAAHHLQEAVSYRIERLSPFPPANTLYALRAVSKDDRSAELEAQAVITARAFADGIRERANALGLGIRSFAIGIGENGSLETISFASQESSRPKSAIHYRAFVAASAFLAGTLIFAPIVAKERALARIEEEIARLKPQAEQAGKLRVEGLKFSSLLTKVVALKQSSPSPLAVLAKLSAALDDKTFLVDLRLEGANAVISGFSSDAPGLAQRLSGTPGFEAVKFQGPVTRDPQTSRDRFTLAIEIAPPS